MKEKPYHYLDNDIRYLVACMNAYAYRTYASCHGHGYPVDIVMPYVAFTSSVPRPHGFAGVCVQMPNQESLS